MPRLLNDHPPVRGKQAISLSLLKRPEGASQAETANAGGGTRLAAQVGKLEAKGHRFERKREGREGYARYWWQGWEQPSASASPLPSPKASHKLGTYSANL